MFAGLSQKTSAKMDVKALIARNGHEAKAFKPITVSKQLDLDYDLGRLLACDSNILDQAQLRSDSSEYLRSLTRDNVQLLINQIWELPTERVDEIVVAKLPRAKFTLPRAKPVPKPKPLTKWQQFALDKGIKKKTKSKLTWDETLKKWIPAYGYKRAAADKDKDWLLEVPQNADPYEDQFEKKALAKSEKVAKNELQRMRNIARAKRVKLPRAGVLNPEMLCAKELQTAVTVAKAATASVGTFQKKLPKEKEASNVHNLVPGGSRKRKMPPTTAEQEKADALTMMDGVLSKRPLMDINKAVARHMNAEDVSRAEAGRSSRPKSKAGRKPKSGKGVRKGSGNKGRKRR